MRAVRLEPTATWMTRPCGAGWLALAICVALFASPLAAARARDAITLEFSAPAGCPQRDDILRAVDAQLGAGFASETRIAAEASVSARSPNNYQLTLSYTTGSGARDVRQIAGESCAAVADAAVLVLALALAPSPSLNVDEPAPPSASTLLVSAVGRLDGAFMPRLATAFGLGVGWAYGALEVHAGAYLFLPQHVERGGVIAQLSLWSVELGACYMFDLRPLVLGPCADAELGQLSGRASGPLAAATPGSARVQALRAAAAARLALFGPIELQLRVGWTWITRRPEFVVDEVGSFARPASSGLYLVLGPLLAW